MPPEAWGAVGLIGGAIVAGAIAWLNGRRAQRHDTGTLALNIANSLREDVNRLSARVEVLERDRNAYRSWSHTLWSHIHNERVPRTPAPDWPEDLAR